MAHDKLFIPAKRLFLAGIIVFLLSLCPEALAQGKARGKVVVGAERSDILLPMLKGKRVAIVGNHTSRVSEETLLPEALLAEGVQVVRLFSPEHGFRGTADAGEVVKNGIDPITKLPVVSLYGSRKKPTPEELKDVDVLLFDLQDVGTRFYTYISTMHYAMEAAAESGIPFVVLDRPNPNDFVAGPIREASCRSFISMHPIPILHGLTVGELALMINGEGWLSTSSPCEVHIVPLLGWQHGDLYQLPVPPSPNLRSPESIAHYPTLCLFEATILSVGRGTEDPFTLLGHPDKRFGDYTFVPQSRLGAKKPKYKGKICYGKSFKELPPRKPFDVALFIEYYQLANRIGYKVVDRKRTFELLVGNKHLLNQIEKGMTAEEIEATWQRDLDEYRTLRKKYLLYPDYE